ncbi:MAG: GAF domain-containing protein [Vulcanimicrobiota bacterium]
MKKKDSQSSCLKGREKNIIMKDSMETETLKALERSKKLLEISEKANSSLDLSETLNSTVKLAAEAMNVKSCTIRLIAERGQKMEIKAVWGLSLSFLMQGPFNLEDLPIDQQVMQGEIVYIPHVTKDPRFICPEAAEKEGIVSALCVPLKAMDRVLGTMRAYTSMEYEFSEEEKNFFLTIANQAAIAVNNAMNHERMHTLFLVSNSLSKSLDIRQVFVTVTEEATKAMNARGCAVFLLNNNTDAFVLEQHYGVSDMFLRFMEEEYVNRSKHIRRGEPVIIEDFLKELYLYNPTTVMQEGIHSFMSIPLKPKQHVIGLLQLYFTIARDFASDEVEFFKTLATAAAVAIENAKLYEHINTKYLNLVEDIFLWHDGANRRMEY